MDDRFQEDMAPDAASKRKQVLFVALAAFLIFFLLDDIIGWIGGGGLFSVTSALDATRGQPPLIDVDEAGLRTLFVALCGLAASLVAVQLNSDLGQKLPQFLFMIAIVGGGFVLDAVYDERIVTRVMAGYGYSRCAARDHSEGHGKSRIGFNNYVRNGNDCPSLPITIVPAPAIPPADPRRELPRPARSIGSPAAWFTQDDYPDDALRLNQQGATTVRFVVDRTGRVTQCHAAKTSGVPLLDATTCAVFVTNGRYWPARNAAGKPVPQAGNFRIRWALPPAESAGPPGGAATGGSAPSS